MEKVSIRFYNDQLVRAVWDEETSELVSATTQLKLKAADGKKRLTDCMDMESVRQLVLAIPNNKARNSQWFFQSNKVHGESKTIYQVGWRERPTH